MGGPAPVEPVKGVGIYKIFYFWGGETKNFRVAEVKP